MVPALLALEQLPRQNASQVKNKWGEVVRLVQQSGSVAVTNHSAVEMVLVNASTYRQLADDLQALRTREQSVLDELAQRFDARLAVLQQADAGQRMADVFAAKGRLARPPRAGASF